MAQATIDTTDNRLVVTNYKWFKITLLGAATGLVTWLLSLGIGTFILDPLMCQGQLSGCSAVPVVAYNIAAVVATVLALGAMIRWLIPRALVVAIASLVALWGVGTFTKDFFWLEAAGWTIVLFALAYTVFSMIVRVRNIAIVIACSLIVVILARLMMTV